MFGDESLEVAETLASLAMSGYTGRSGELVQAIGYAEESLAIRERLLGLDAILTNRIRGLLAMYRAVASGKASSSFDNPMLVMALASIRQKNETPEQVIAWGREMVLACERLGAGGEPEAAQRQSQWGVRIHSSPPPTTILGSSQP